jgi:hypothetical protein
MLSSLCGRPACVKANGNVEAIKWTGLVSRLDELSWKQFNVNVKFSMNFIKHHAMETYGGV